MSRRRPRARQGGLGAARGISIKVDDAITAYLCTLPIHSKPCQTKTPGSNDAARIGKALSQPERLASLLVGRPCSQLHLCF